MKIYLGADHGGYELKEKAKSWLHDWGYQYEDLGAHRFDPADDYPHYAFAVAEKVAQEPEAVGVLLCRSGGGVTIAANKVKGVRAVPVNSEQEAIHAREHNNANVISLSGDWLGDEQAQVILKRYLVTSFTAEERHQRRLAQIAQYESAN